MNVLSWKPHMNSQAMVWYSKCFNFQFLYTWKLCFVISWFPETISPWQCICQFVSLRRPTRYNILTDRHSLLNSPALPSSLSVTSPFSHLLGVAVSLAYPTAQQPATLSPIRSLSTRLHSGCLNYSPQTSFRYGVPQVILHK